MCLNVRGVITDKGDGSYSENIKYRSTPKNMSSVRTLPIPNEVGAYLGGVKQKQEADGKLAKSTYNKQWVGFVCVDALGNITRPEALSRAFPSILKQHGLRPIRFHELRDSNASILLDRGVDMKRIQAWLGHSHYSTTADIYAHLKSDAKQGLGEILSKELVKK